MRKYRKLTNTKNLRWHDMVKKERVALICLVLLTLEYVIHYYVGIGVAPKIVIYINAFVAVFFPMYSLIAKPPRKINFYSVVLVIVYFAILIYTLFLAGFNGRLSRDIVCITIYLQILAAILYQDLSTDFIYKFLELSAIISIIGFLYSIKTINNFNLAFAINRGYQYEEIFYYAALFWSASPFMILSMIKKKNIWFAGLNLELFVIINLIIVKRIVLLQVGVLAVVLFGMVILEPESNNRRKKKTIRRLLLFIVVMFVLLRLFVWDTVSGLFNSIFERTVSVVEDNLSLFDRFQESFNYLKSASPFDIIIGKGFGGLHYGLGSASEALHVGWVNFLLKGGIVLFFMMLIPFIKSIGLVFNYRAMPEKTRFAFWYTIYMFPILFLSNMHSFCPQLFFYVYCCIEVMSYKRARRRKH